MFGLKASNSKYWSNTTTPRPAYQGTIYQRVDTGEIIVAHRGTELDREKINDALYTEGGMA